MFWIQHVCAESSMNVSSQYVMRCVFDVYYSQTNPCDPMCVCVSKLDTFKTHGPQWSITIFRHQISSTVGSGWPPSFSHHAALDVQLGTSEDFEVRFAESN